MGSQADYTCLAHTLAAYESAEKMALWLGVSQAWGRADALYATLTGCAFRCGYRPTSNTTVEEFARKRLATYRQAFGRAA